MSVRTNLPGMIKRYAAGFLRKGASGLTVMGVAMFCLTGVALLSLNNSFAQEGCIEDLGHWKVPFQPLNAHCQKCHTTCTPGGSGSEHDFCADGGEWNRPESSCMDCHENIHWTHSPGVCNDCHGGDDNAAPPSSTTGETDTSAITVGAHQAHLTGGSIRSAMDCSNCHNVPRNKDDAGHMDDDSPAEVGFSGLATARGANPEWRRDTATCVNVYCHGATLDGGTNKSPTWTTVNGSQDACGTCHGYPPRGGHPRDDDRCSECHSPTVNWNGTIKVEAGYHIDGRVQYTDD